VVAIGETILAKQHAPQAERGPLEKALAQIERRLEPARRICLQEAISTAELNVSRTPLKTRRSEIEDRLACSGSVERSGPVVAATAPAYAAMAVNLHLALAERGGEAIRELIARVDFIPLQGPGRFDL
jgi:hypothetical protein